MKKCIRGFLLIALVVCLMPVVSGCDDGNVNPSPTVQQTPKMTPMTTIDASMTPQVTSSSQPVESPSGSPGESGNPNPSGSPSGIDNFVEGTVVKPEDVPELVNAITKQYADATIQSITHATYQGEQVYKVILKMKGDESKEVYARANYELISEDNASPSPSSSGSGGTGGTNN